MEKNLFENGCSTKHDATSQHDMEAAKQAIQSAYSQCSPQEKQQLQQSRS